jgi:hypothetical protein
MNRTVTEVEKRLLKQRLVELKLQLSGDSQTHVLQPELIHGLTDEVISDIVVKSEILFTPDDVMKNCQIQFSSLHSQFFSHTSQQLCIGAISDLLIR